MLKIGERELTVKELVAAGVFVVVAITLVGWMLMGKPKPVVMHPPAQPGLVLLEGGQPGSGPGQFAYPRGIAVDSRGDIYVADSRNHRIEKISGKDGKYVADFGGLGKVEGDPQKIKTMLPGKLNEPNGVAVGPGDTIYVIDTWNSRVQVFGSNGKFKDVFTSDDG